MIAMANQKEGQYQEQTIPSAGKREFFSSVSDWLRDKRQLAQPISEQSWQNQYDRGLLWLLNVPLSYYDQSKEFLLTKSMKFSSSH